MSLCKLSRPGITKVLKSSTDMTDEDDDRNMELSKARGTTIKNKIIGEASRGEDSGREHAMTP